MEAIKTFDVDIDLSQVYKLYDYGRGEYIHRKLGEDWDMRLIHTRAADDHVDEKNETFHARLKQMDYGFHVGRCFEKNVDKKKAEEEIPSQNFGVYNVMQPSQNLPKRVLPVFKPGDVVRGHLVLELTDKVDAAKLRMTFKGRAQVRIRVYHGKGYYDDHGEVMYAQGDWVYWEKSEGNTDDVSDSFALLSAQEGVSSKSAFIPPGLHRFPFEVCIPADAVGSVPDIINSCADYGHINYRFKATIDKGKLWSRGSIITLRGIWIDKSMDIAKDPEGFQPVSVEETLNTGFIVNTGRVCIRASLPKKAYVRGEIIHLTVDVENGNSQPIELLKARVKLAGKMRTGTGKLRPCRSMSVKSSKVKSVTIPGDTVQRVQMKVPLDFSDSYLDNNLIPAGTLDDCILLDVRYEIEIKAKRKGAHRDMEIKIPITIGTENSSENLYPSLT